MQDDDDKKFEEKFKRWPSLFNLEVSSKQTDRDIEDNIGTLVRKLESGEVECTKERVKINNILSFLSWKLNKKNEAETYLKLVLSADEQNINARCSQIWMDWASGLKTAAIETLEKLSQEDESSDEFKQHHNRAKAETAYYCSVSGPSHFHHSVSLYDEIIFNSNGDETDVWRFDRAIVLRKICNDENITRNKEYQELKYEDYMKKAAHELHALTRSGIGKRKIAVCWVSLGELLTIFERRQRPSINQSDIFPEELAEANIETLLENALSEKKDDTHVLKVCGKIFRYINKFDRTEECLIKSLELRKTSYAYHHLALVLIEKIKVQGKEQEKSNVATRRRYQISEKGKSLAPEIIQYLEEARQMNRNEWASFELGLLYLSLDQPAKAFGTFSDTLKLRKEPSLVMEINCYEHQGFCRLDLAKAAKNAVDAHRHEEDAKYYFLKAIRLAACNASQLIHWKEECIALPTLKEMFEAKERNIITLRELSELNRMIGEHGKALSFYDEIIKMDPEQANDSLFIRGKIHTYLDAKQYADAATFLDLMSCTKGEQLIPLELYADVYLKFAFYCIENNRPPKEFRKRLRQAFSASKKTVDGKYNFKFDIFLLHDEDAISDGLKEKFLQEFTNYLAPSDDRLSGLHITMNSENVQPGRNVRPEQIKQMEDSAYIIVVMDEEETQSPNFKQYLQIAQDIHHDSSNRTTLVSILLNDRICPREMIVYPTMAFKKDVFHDKYPDHSFVQWLKECLHKILAVNLP
ncbi:hypothetical protein ACJMK2_021965 [Sinanodonta woodiana]|uniref:TIR domain-containing protein n=1 Tax=Sinanodonta woodiana TaxID=1069815 RepID=A0ABD3THM3_SINWO